jgi:hypothetical protein
MLGMVCGIGWMTGPAAAVTLLSEVYYDAVGTDDGQLFVEIAGTPGASLEGFVIEGINGSNGAAGPTILLSGAIGLDGVFVVADRTSAGTTSVLGADLLANFDFQNGPDSVVLRDGDVVVDALGYGVFGAGEVFAGEGDAAPDVDPGSSLARVFANLDSGDNLTDFEVLTTPTPGLASFAPVPEPGTGLMIGLGLSGLACAGGRHRRPASSRLRPPIGSEWMRTARRVRTGGSKLGQEDRLVLFPQGLNVLHPSVQVPGRQKDRDQ